MPWHKLLIAWWEGKAQFLLILVGCKEQNALCDVNTNVVSNSKMKEYLTILISMCVLSSCNFHKDSEASYKKDYYLVEDLNNDLYENSDLVPVSDYYTKHNILLVDSTKEIFYHNKYFSCGTGWSATDPPRSIDLTNGELITFGSIKDLIELIKASTSTPRLVVIASDVDTIRSEIYFELVQELNKIDKCYILKTRKMTDDELDGLQWKRNNKK